MPLHKLRKLGENSTGDKAGLELPRDELRRIGVMDEDGNLVERPQVGIDLQDDGEQSQFRLTVYRGDELDR